MQQPLISPHYYLHNRKNNVLINTSAAEFSAYKLQTSELDQCARKPVEFPLFMDAITLILICWLNLNEIKNFPDVFSGHVTIKSTIHNILLCKKQMQVVNHMDYKTHPPIPPSSTASQRS